MESKLATAEDRFQRGPDTIIVVTQLSLHLLEQWLVGKLYRAPQRIAEQFSAELPHEVLTPLVQQVRSQTGQAAEHGAIWQTNTCIDGLVDEILLTVSANGVKGLQCEPERVDAAVAAGAFGGADMLFRPLSYGESLLADGIWKIGYVGGRVGKTLAEQCFHDPISA